MLFEKPPTEDALDLPLLSTEKSQYKDELIRLKEHLDLVEEGRLAGTQGLSVGEARIRLMEKYKET